MEVEDTKTPDLERTISPSISSTPAQPYTTSTPPQSTPFTNIEGTIIATGQIYGTDKALTDTKFTNEDGEILFVDENGKASINIQVIDENEGIPIPEILVHWVSYDDEFLVIVADLDGDYLPAGISGKYIDLRTSSGIIMLTNYDETKLLQDGWEELKLVIKLVNGLEDINSLKDLAGYLADWPDIIEHAEFHGLYTDFCMTGEEIANLGSLAMLLIPGGNVEGVVGPELLKPAIVAITKHFAEEEAKVYLSALEGRYSLRIYNIPIPFIALFSYQGRCDELIKTQEPPISTEEPDSEFDFPIVNIGFPNSIYVRYDPSVWDAIEMDPVYQTEAGEPVSSLQHKDFPYCNIHNNWGHGMSPDYEFSINNKIIGDLDYQLETWSDPPGKPILTVYQHSPTEWIVRIELSIGSEPDVCIQDAEEVLAISSDLLINIEEPHLTDGQIAYIEKGFESTSLNLINSDGSNIETLLTSWLSDPTWSPDGQEIILAERLSSANTWQIISVNLITKQSRILVSTEIPGFPDYNEWYYRYRNPRLPSDGDTLYFIMGGDTPIEAILQLEVDSGVFHQVLPTMIISSFDISSDNKLVDIFCNPQDIDCYINVRYPIDLKVSNTIYHRKDQTVCCAVWSPDGQEIAFIAPSELTDSRDAPGHIWIMSSDGSDQRQLTFDDKFNESEPNWSPAGNWLVFSRKRVDDHFADVWIVSTDGEILNNLSNSPNISEEQPIWRPNP